MSEKRKLTIKNSKGKNIELIVELSESFFKHIKGLMFRNSLADDEGMLFVFPDEKPRSLWMLFTKIPLEALFFGGDGKLLEIISMEPCTGLFCPTYPSKTKAKYVLEVGKGFSKKNSIEITKSKLAL